MDKSFMNNDKKIEINQNVNFHRLIEDMPALPREYGLWVIDGTENFVEKLIDIDQCKDRRFEFYSLSHMFAGRGKLRIGMNTVDVLPGDCVLICPGDWHYYCGSNNEYYVEDSIRFVGRLPDTLRRNGILRSGKYHLGKIRELLPLIASTQSKSKDAWLKSAILLQSLLWKLIENNRKSSPMETLLETIRNAPKNYWWSVNELAELRGISPGRLRREFLKHTGMLPKNYLENFKLHQAAYEMLTKNLSVTKTAMEFGYMDRYHFSRRFKNLFGVSPENYRKSHTAGQNQN